MRSRNVLTGVLLGAGSPRRDAALPPAPRAPARAGGRLLRRRVDGLAGEARRGRAAAAARPPDPSSCRLELSGSAGAILRRLPRDKARANGIRPGRVGRARTFEYEHSASSPGLLLARQASRNDTGRATDRRRARPPRCVSTPTSRGISCSASGRRSRYYLDKYRFETRSDLLGPLGERIAQVVAEPEPEAVRLAGPELGAVPLAAAASLASGLPFLIVRKEAKEYGTGNRLEGVLRGRRKRSVSSRTWSPRAAPRWPRSRALREAGLTCRTAVCVVDREEGGMDALARVAVRLRPLFRASELVWTCKSPALTAWLSQNRRTLLGSGAVLALSKAAGEGARDQAGSSSSVWRRRAALAVAEAGEAVDAVIESITDALEESAKRSPSPGFGKFTTQHRAARKGSTRGTHPRRCRSRRRGCRSSLPEAHSSRPFEAAEVATAG